MTGHSYFQFFPYQQRGTLRIEGLFVMKKHESSPYKWDRWYTKTSSLEENDAFEQMLRDSTEAEEHLKQRKALYVRLHQREGFAELLQQGIQQLEKTTQQAEKPLPAKTQRAPGKNWLQWLFGEGSWGFSGAVLACALLLFLLPNSPMKMQAVAPPANKRQKQQKRQTKPTEKKGQPASPEPKKRVLPKRKAAVRPPFDRSSGDNVGKSHHIEFKTLYLRRGATRSFQAAPSQVLHPGDFIQFAYSAGRPHHVMIVSLNDKGEVSLFVPFSQSKQSYRVDSGRGLLPDALGTLELDDYIGKERIFFVYASKSFTFAQLKRTIEQSFQQADRSVEKLKALPGPWQWKDLVIVKKPKKPKKPNPR